MALSPLDLSLTTLRDLTGNWVRSGLTALGIFMGVAAVNATLNIDTIANRVLQERLEARDNPNITPWVYGRDRPPVEFDAAAIAYSSRTASKETTKRRLRSVPIKLSKVLLA